MPASPSRDQRPSHDQRPSQKDALAALSARVADDLNRIAHPTQEWLTPRTGPDGRDALDVLIVGAGQSGVATGFALKRARVDNILAIDAAPPGREGPWRTYARMNTLRSPKTFTGPDLDIPSLTYQSWHEAVYGPASWEALDLIDREDWADYLLWVREVTGVPTQNHVRLTAIHPAGDLLTASIETLEGPQTLYARKIVLATGQESTGRWWMPDELAALPATHVAHTADDIDFDALRGKTVFVLGAGASAFDNAAMALEAGARVHLYCRRASPQVIQPYRWLTFRGFLRHLSDLPDEWRWRFMRHILSLREGFPQATYDRCARHDTFHLVTGEPGPACAWPMAALSSPPRRASARPISSSPAPASRTISPPGPSLQRPITTSPHGRTATPRQRTNESRAWRAFRTFRPTMRSWRRSQARRRGSPTFTFSPSPRP